MTKEDVIEILERFVIGAKPCSQREIVDACASAYRMLEEQPSLPSNLDEAAEVKLDNYNALAYLGGVEEGPAPLYCMQQMLAMFKAGAQWMDKQIPKFPDDLDEAAEKYAGSHYYECMFDGDLEDAFKAGAEWMAEQGETIEGTLGYGPHLQRPIIMLEGVPKFYDGHSQEVIVNIRKA